MKIAVNYATSNWESARSYCSKIAISKGGCDKVFEYSPEILDYDFLKFEKEVFHNSNYEQFGLWRPYIIVDAMKKAASGDYIFYIDSGAYLINTIDYLIEDMNKKNTDILTFELPFIEKQWSKRDAFVYLGCDKKEYTDTNQRLSTYFLLKVTEYSKRFFNEYLEIALNAPFLFDNSDNKLGKENYYEFIENRHNQTVLSLLAKKYELPVFRDVSEFGLKKNIYKKIYKNNTDIIILPLSTEPYKHPVIVASHRSNQCKLHHRLLEWIKIYMPWSMYRSIDILFGILIKIKHKLKGK